MSSKSWLVGWVININDQEIKVLRRNRKHRLSRNKTHSNVVIGDWIAFRKNTAYGQGCLIQIIDPVLPTKTFWIKSRMDTRSPQTECVCVKTTAIGSPDVQLQEGDCGICRIWSPHFEYLADPLHLFNDPVNVKPNVAYDVWCRLNSDPESQYDGVSPILEIHSIEAPSESQMISLCAPWMPGSLCNPIDQVLSLDPPASTQNQQFTVESQESSAETQEKSSGRRKICGNEHLRSIWHAQDDEQSFHLFPVPY
ncbi:unnamed protein product [Anisakis simplex]|uniref:BAH domain-containing protein n=1 Tax=Anisakis simplex TaxID=6269 RepID=A0A0M3K8J2_ANISI|nr:unnamed protein product [Anisakis simplex]